MRSTSEREMLRLAHANASSPAFNGNLAPVRQIFTATTADILRPRGLDCDDRDDLYVANGYITSEDSDDL